MKQCTTHHYACDCREARIKMILRTVLLDHIETRKLLAGFGKFEPCDCDICKIQSDIESKKKARVAFEITKLFPRYRGHTIEEREAYSNFIDSFFEEAKQTGGGVENRRHAIK